MLVEPFALVADTGTVIVEAEVTATELDALVIEVADDDDADADEWGLLGPEELLDEATVTYSVEVIVAALVVVGQSVPLRKVVVEPVVVVIGLVVTVVVESKPFTCSSNDSSVFVDLSAVVLLADVPVVVHFITGRGLLVTLLELLLLPLLLLLLL